MPNLKISDIPLFLRDSDYIKFILEKSENDDTAIINIPDECYTSSTVIDSCSAFRKLVKCSQYFGIKYPLEVEEYYENNSIMLCNTYLYSNNKLGHEILLKDVEVGHMFKEFYKLPIKSLDMFLGHYIIGRIYAIEASDDFIEYGMENKKLFYKKYQESYDNFLPTVNSRDDIFEDIDLDIANIPGNLEESYIMYRSKEGYFVYDINKYIYNLYNELFRTIMFSFKTEITIPYHTDYRVTRNFFIDNNSIGVNYYRTDFSKQSYIRIKNDFRFSHLYSIFSIKNKQLFYIYNNFLHIGRSITYDNPIQGGEILEYLDIRFEITIFNKKLIMNSIDDYVEKYNIIMDKFNNESEIKITY